MDGEEEKEKIEGEGEDESESRGECLGNDVAGFLVIP